MHRQNSHIRTPREFAPQALKLGRVGFHELLRVQLRSPAAPAGEHSGLRGDNFSQVSLHENHMIMLGRRKERQQVRDDLHNLAARLRHPGNVFRQLQRFLELEITQRIVLVCRALEVREGLSAGGDEQLHHHGSTAAGQTRNYGNDLACGYLGIKRPGQSLKRSGAHGLWLNNRTNRTGRADRGAGALAER